MLFKRSPRPEAPIIHAADGELFDVLSAHAGVALVDFWAPWCGPCRMMGPILDEIAIEHAEHGVRVIKVNVDQAPETAAEFDVRSIPTLIFFEDGEPLFEMVGAVPKPVLERELGHLRDGSDPDAGSAAGL